MKAKYLFGIVLLVALAISSSFAGHPLVTFQWNPDTATWTLHNVNGLEVKVPRELRLVQINQNTSAFALSGYEGGRSSDYFGFIVRDGIYVKCPLRKSFEQFRNSVEAHGGVILENGRTPEVFKYVFPVSSKFDQKTRKEITPAIITVTAYGWVFRSKEGLFCDVAIHKNHGDIARDRWSPEVVFSPAEIELIGKVYHEIKQQSSGK